MTIPEAAVLLGLAPATLRLQIRLGKLAARKVGRDWYVSAEEVESYRRVHLRQKGANPEGMPVPQ
jgi:excisionase family DNA binding protein